MQESHDYQDMLRGRRAGRLLSPRGHSVRSRSLTVCMFADGLKMSGPKSPALCLNLTAVDWPDILPLGSHAQAQHMPIAAPLTPSATPSLQHLRRFRLLGWV